MKHEDIIKQLEELNIDGKDLRVIRNIYWQQTAAIRINNQLGAFQCIKKGVRQGCVLSPDLFSLYSEYIMRSIGNMPGIVVGGHNINNLRYADDTVLIATSQRELQKIMDTVVVESEKMGLKLNNKKTEVMVISKKRIIPKCKIKVGGISLEQVQKFKYLGTWITSDGRGITEIKNRIGQAKTAFYKMKSILCNKSLSLEVRKRILACYIEPVLTYGCESWTISKQAIKSLEAAEMWCYRRMLRIPWTAKMSNIKVLKEARAQKQLIANIRRRQS